MENGQLDMISKGGTGGSADESGSLHRNGVAAYLAAHALAGLSVNNLPGAVPVKIHLEADTAVDDIVCEMEDGAVWYIQAKHEAGKDKALRDAIRQWVDQATEPKDRLVLASRELRGLLRDLQPTLDKYARGRSVALTGTEKQRVGTMRDELSDGGAKAPAQTLKRVLLLNCAVDSSGDAQAQLAVACLATAVVPPVHANAAFEALRGFMQHSASRREWSTPRDWVRALEDANIPTVKDPQASPGAALSAQAHALREYRELHGSRLNELDLTALHPTLGILKVSANLLSGWEVDVKATSAGPHTPQGLIHVVRRNRRFVLFGDPGIGKSEALRQMVSLLAATSTAPLPIHVDLRSILPDISNADSITLDLLLRSASRSVASEDPSTLLHALRESVQAGDALFLVDGLDEARERRGVVAAGLARLVEELPEETGFVMSTRPSALDAASQLELPVVELLAPQSLTSSLECIVEAMSKQIPWSARKSWISARLDSIRTHSGSVEEVWRVPLLASLATIRLCDGLAPGTTAATLLRDVVLDAVKGWRKNRTGETDDFDSAMRPEMLMDGFIVIGKALCASGELSTDCARAMVMAQLGRWELAEPVAEIVAAEVIHYWDHHVGIFLHDANALVARSRQFAEIADAWWIAREAAETKHEWLRAAIRDADRKHAVRLAVSQDAELRQGLIALARRGQGSPVRARAIEWIRECWSEWSSAAPDDLEESIAVLNDAAEDWLPATSEQAGIVESFGSVARGTDEGWVNVVALARAPLPPGLDELRQQRLVALPLSGERASLVKLILELRAAIDESAPLTAAQRDAVEAILYGPTPAPHSSDWSPDGVLHFDIVEAFTDGVSDALEMAVQRVTEFSDSAPDAFYRLARHCSMYSFNVIRQALILKGFSDPRPLLSSSLKTSLDVFLETFKDYRGVGWILRILGSLHVDDVALSTSQSWRALDLSDLMEVLNIERLQFEELQEAQDLDAEFLRNWFASASDTFGLDMSLVATQARSLLSKPGDSANLVEHIVLPSLTSLSRLAPVECSAATMLAGGFSGSVWVARQMYLLLNGGGCPSVAEAIAAQPEPAMWESSFLANLTGVLHAADRRAWMASSLVGSSARRAAIASFARQHSDDFDETIRVLCDDPDATVRARLGAPLEGATMWTCAYCSAVCNMAQQACPRCHRNGPLTLGT